MKKLIPRVILAASTLAYGAAAAAYTQTGELSGAAKWPGPGDPDGSGTFTLTLDPDGGEVCYELSTKDIQPATAAHIHAGVASETGPVVLPLETPADGSAQGCVIADHDLVRSMIARPASYYVNVHNAEFPGGAVRGQLDDRELKRLPVDAEQQATGDGSRAVVAPGLVDDPRVIG